MNKTVNNILKIAKEETGYLEKKSNKYLNHKTKNAGKNNYTKYSAVFGTNGCFWCCYYICWLFYMLCGKSKLEAKKVLWGTLSGACETMRQSAIKKGRYYKKPKVGDWVFFSGKRHKGANHVALVTKVTQNRVYTNEGNTSGASKVVDNGGGVVEKSYPLTYSKIMGYGRPYYKEEEKLEFKTEIVETNKTESLPNIKDIKLNVQTAFCYKKYTGKSKKVDEVLKAIGVPAQYRGTWKKRKTLALKNGIKEYKGTMKQNLKLINLAKQGKLKIV